MALPHVYLLTWCRAPHLLYGNTLVFQTLRVGFPNAPIHVIDGASLPEAREPIRSAAKSCGVEFIQLDRRLELYDYMPYIINRQPEGAAVFVDTDMCFWERIEHWTFEGLAAGRYIPRHQCDYTGCLTEQRLHTSLLWFSDVVRLRNAIATARQTRRYFEPFRGVMVNVASRWHFFDNAAGLYAMFPKEMCAFGEAHLAAYDHLFSGTFSDAVSQKLGQDFGAAYAEVHRMAQIDYRAIRGCWRHQESYFQARRLTEGNNPVPYHQTS